MRKSIRRAINTLNESVKAYGVEDIRSLRAMSKLFSEMLNYTDFRKNNLPESVRNDAFWKVAQKFARIAHKMMDESDDSYQINSDGYQLVLEKWTLEGDEESNSMWWETERIACI